MANCGSCGVHLTHIDEACPNCLPDMAERPPVHHFWDPNQGGSSVAEREVTREDRRRNEADERIAELEGQLAEKQVEVDDQIQFGHDAEYKMFKKFEEAEKREAVLREDKKRLDWLQKEHDKSGYKIELRPGVNPPFERIILAISVGSGPFQKEYKAATLRQVIDKARAALEVK